MSPLEASVAADELGAATLCATWGRPTYEEALHRCVACAGSHGHRRSSSKTSDGRAHNGQRDLTRCRCSEMLEDLVLATELAVLDVDDADVPSLIDDIVDYSNLFASVAFAVDENTNADARRLTGDVGHRARYAADFSFAASHRRATWSDHDRLG